MRENKRKSKNGDKWLWLASSSLLPAVAMAYLYRQNIAYVSQQLMLFIGAGMLVISAIAWVILYILFRSPVSAFVACLTCWIMCFAANWILGIIFVKLGIESHLLMFFAICMLLLAAIVSFVFRKVRWPNTAGFLVLAFLCILLFMNIVPVITNNINTTGRNNPTKYIKTDFVTESHEQRPNIYYVHCDGMLGFKAMEKYFGDAQNEFAEKLIQRGFAFNRDANFESGHITQIAIANLMCPYAYDNWIFPRAHTHEEAMKLRDYANMRRIFLDFRLHNEMITALEKGGYFTQTIVTGNQYFFPTTDVFYYPANLETVKIRPDSTRDQIRTSVEMHEAQDFLDKVSVPLGRAFYYISALYEKLVFSDKAPNLMAYIYEFFGQYEMVNSSMTDEDIHNVLLGGMDEGNSTGYYKSMVRSLNDSFAAEPPYFDVIWVGFAHYPYIYNENGNIVNPDDNMNLFDYPAQHKYTSKVLLNMVDMILASDPEAVIVLQADHGLHGNTEEDFEQAFNVPGASIDLWNNVFSAIRVPKEYENGQESYMLENPLNIARYLVNSYVGKNYEYLVDKVDKGGQ